MTRKEAIQQILVADKKRDLDQTKTILDALRKTRSARGLGEPLKVPAHLRDDRGNTIILTDADIDLADVKPATGSDDTA